VNQAEYDELAYDFARMMSVLLLKWSNAENDIANVLTDSLGALVAISAKEPAVTLERVAGRLKAFPWKDVRTAHFGERLGVPAQNVEPVVGELIQFGRPKK
jgi:hypothetical protein